MQVIANIVFAFAQHPNHKTASPTHDHHQHASMTVNHHVAAVLLLFLLPSVTGQAATTDAPPPFNFNLGPAFNPTMAIVMIVLVSAFFSLGFFSVYMRRCAERRMHGGGGWAADGPLLFGGGRRSWRAARGVCDEVIRSFPTFRYSAVKGLKIGKGSLECAVCLNEFEDDETLRLLPKCSHVFHSDCIDAWLSSHSTCPVCRANLVPKPGENLSSVAIQIPDRDMEAVEPDRELNIQSQSLGPVLRSPEVNMVSPSPRAWTGQNRPPRTKSSGLRFAGLFSRSHSTGHSLVQPGENCERYTLRLPEEVRSQILISSLNRTRSLGVLPRARSDRRGYRSGKSYSQYERFDREIRPDRWGFSRTPPFISRTGSVQSRGSEEAMAARTPPRSLLRSFKTPVDRLFLGSDDIGERSSDRLRPDSHV